MLFFISVVLTTILITVFTERFIQPKATVFSAKTLALHSAIITSLFLGLTLIVQRPIFSSLTVIIFFMIVVAVNNAKYTALKEPLVFSDFAMFAQAFKHPRLYFGFLGLAPVIIATTIIISLIIGVLYLEPALPFTWQRILSTVSSIVILLFLSRRFVLTLNLSEDIETDNATLGIVNNLFSYFMHAKAKEHDGLIKTIVEESPFNTINLSPPPFLPLLYNDDKTVIHKPNITVIQSESFFDARRLHPAIKKSILKNFDKINKESLQYGKLKVPAWGANTMRTEFSFLSAIPNEKLGFHRYYPYQFLAKYQLHTIASALKNQGYYCVCIHPHPASFFGRDKIFPKMGFDEFIDIDDFQAAEKFGPYISDETVTQKILEITQKKTDKPLFIFVITMENHGPLHLEKTSKEEQIEYFESNHAKDLPHELNDLTVYLRHLKNADKMIKTLTDEYRKSEVETTLCFYGDHVPSMPTIYQQTNYQDEHSDYFIWQSNTVNDVTRDFTRKNAPTITHIESLSLDVLKAHFDTLTRHINSIH